MRIISGIYGGRRLSPPKNITARPTTDFAKESLFNLLNNRMDFEDIDVLDLFAGTGGIGIECVSRGAREVTAVELAHVQQNWIIQCCRQLGIHNLTVIRGDAFKFMLKPEGWLVIEHGKDVDFTSHPRHIETRQYGSVHFSFFQ